MLQSIIFLLAFLPTSPDFSRTELPVSECTCEEVSHLQKTGETSNSISFSWSEGMDATQYKVGYVRHSDEYNSGYFYTTNLSFTFTNLAPGSYTFYFAVVCGSETSNITGVEDLIQT